MRRLPDDVPPVTQQLPALDQPWYSPGEHRLLPIACVGSKCELLKYAPPSSIPFQISRSSSCRAHQAGKGPSQGVRKTETTCPMVHVAMADEDIADEQKLTR